MTFDPNRSRNGDARSWDLRGETGRTGLTALKSPPEDRPLGDLIPVAGREGLEVAHHRIDAADVQNL